MADATLMAEALRKHRQSVAMFPSERVDEVYLEGHNGKKILMGAAPKQATPVRLSTIARSLLVVLGIMFGMVGIGTLTHPTSTLASSGIDLTTQSPEGIATVRGYTLAITAVMLAICFRGVTAGKHLKYSGQVPERDEAFAACALLLGCIVTARALSMLDSHVEEDFDGVGGGGSGGGGSGSSDGRLPKGAESAGAAHIEGGTYWDNIVIVEVFWCIVCAIFWLIGSGNPEHTSVWEGGTRKLNKD